MFGHHLSAPLLHAITGSEHYSLSFIIITLYGTTWGSVIAGYRHISCHSLVFLYVFRPGSVGTVLGWVLNLVVGSQCKLLYNTEITEASLA